MVSITVFSKIIDSFLNPVTIVFVIVLVFIFLRALSAHKAHVNTRASSLAKAAPTLLTTIGVLGTFVGIYVGLLEFNVANIDASIPLLLDGLKIAFVTSIMGMLLAVAYRVYQITSPTEIQTSGVSADEIFTVLSEIRDISATESSSNEDLLTKLNQAISGDSESSIITQLIKMRSELGDKLSALSSDFHDFAESVAENNSKALITALEEVMRDFNLKINEQFGDNFKQLNEAVGQLLTWQENYKKQVDEMIIQFENSLSAIQYSEKSLGNISKQTESISETMSNLETIINALDNQIKANRGAVDAFSEISKKAGDAFPVIESNLKKLTESMGIAVTNCVSTVDQTVSNMTTSFQQSIKNSQEALGEQIKYLDEQMQTEVKRVIEVMGSNLASLSKKFVEDYSPLTEKLQKLVEVGRL